MTKELNRTRIAELKENEKTKISGFVEKLRDTRYMVFVILKDITGKIQVSIDKEKQSNLVETALQGIIGSVVSFEGSLQNNPNVKMGGIEFIPTSVKIESIADASPIDETSSIDQRINYRWLDLRSERNTLIFQIQSCFVAGLREFLLEKNFIEIHTPKLIGAASESGADVFEVKYFDTKAYLAQSPQFYKQMAMSAGFERIFECGPVFRAEKSHTARHSTEFTGFDLEFSYIDSYLDVISMEEDMLIYALKKVKEQWGDKVKDIFDTEVVVPTKPFPRKTLAELYEIFEKKYNYTVPESEKTDLTTEAERLAYQYSMEEFGHEFIFVDGYPPEKRAFYHMRKDGILQGYDLIWRGVEITSGAQREHRYEKIKKNVESKGLGKDVDFYLEFFKYGCPPHGGFGIGVDRMTMLLLNIPHIKEVEFLFRGPSRLTP